MGHNEAVICSFVRPTIDRGVQSADSLRGCEARGVHHPELVRRGAWMVVDEIGVSSEVGFLVIRTRTGTGAEGHAGKSALGSAL